VLNTFSNFEFLCSHSKWSWGGSWCCMGRKPYWLQGMETRAIGI